ISRRGADYTAEKQRQMVTFGGLETLSNEGYKYQPPWNEMRLPIASSVYVCASILHWDRDCWNLSTRRRSRMSWVGRVFRLSGRRLYRSSMIRSGWGMGSGLT